MVMLNTGDGKIIDAVPIGAGVPPSSTQKTTETFSAQVDGTLTVIKEKSPTSFVVEQTVQTKQSAKQMARDSKTDRILVVAADYVPPPSATRRNTCRPRSDGSGFVLHFGSGQVKS